MDKIIINNLWENKNKWSIGYDKTSEELSKYSDSLFYFFMGEIENILNKIGETQANNTRYYKEIQKLKDLLDIK